MPTGSQYYANGSSLNASQITNASPNLRDVSAGDNTTYYSNSGAGAVAISAMWDLGASGGKVGRLRFRWATKDAQDSWNFDYSDDGTTWNNAYTGSTDVGSNACALTWQAEKNTTQINTGTHRYWRLTVFDSDTGMGGCSDWEVRLGDFRIYDDVDAEYTHSNIREAQASAQIKIQALTPSSQGYTPVKAFAQISVQAPVQRTVRIKTSSNPLLLTNILPNSSFSTAGVGPPLDNFGSWAEDATSPSTINRDTADFDSSPAACRFDIGAGAQYAEIYLLNVVPIGPRYRMTVRAKASNGTAGWLFAIGAINSPDVSFVPGTTWATSPTYEFVKRGDANLSLRRNGGNSASSSLWVDDVTVDRYNGLTTWAYARAVRLKTARAVAVIRINATARSGSYKGGVVGVRQIAVQSLTSTAIRVKTTTVGFDDPDTKEFVLPFIQIQQVEPLAQGYTPAITPVGLVQIQAFSVQAVHINTARTPVSQVQVQALNPQPVRVRNASVHGSIPDIRTPRVTISSQNAPATRVRTASTPVSQVQVPAQTTIGVVVHIASTPVSPIQIQALNANATDSSGGQAFAQIQITAYGTGTKVGTRQRVFLIT